MILSLCHLSNSLHTKPTFSHLQFSLQLVEQLRELELDRKQKQLRSQKNGTTLSSMEGGGVTTGIDGTEDSEGMARPDEVVNSDGADGADGVDEYSKASVQNIVPLQPMVLSLQSALAPTLRT